MSNPVVESAGYTNMSASALVRTGAGQLLGIFVASSSAGTVKLWDNTSAATTVIVNTFSATAATFYPIPVNFKNGLYVTIGGTADITVIWNPVN
jgi:hypothetical protein